VSKKKSAGPKAAPRKKKTTATKKKAATSAKASVTVGKKTAVSKKKASSGKKSAPVRNLAEKALEAARAALDKKALDLEILDMRELVYYADYFVICSGTSTQHVDAIAKNVEKELSRLGHKPSGIEGRQSALWVLIDFGDIVVHVFEQETRQYYQLEKLWLDAPRIEYSEAGMPHAKAG